MNSTNFYVINNKINKYLHTRRSCKLNELGGIQYGNIWLFNHNYNKVYEYINWVNNYSDNPFIYFLPKDKNNDSSIFGKIS